MTAGGPVPESAAEHAYVFPVTFAQQRLLFLNQLDPASTTYCVPWSIRIKGSLDAGALEPSLNEIVRRHEILRTTFDIIDGRPMQIVSPSLHVPLVIRDISATPNPEQEAQSAAKQEALTPVDLKNGPVLRTTLLRLQPDDHVLLLTLHHIVFDGWSRRILIGELAALYEAFCDHRPSPLPELPLQYADFAVWQRNHMQGERLEKLLDYWKQQLAGAPTTLDLPTDRPRPPVQSYRGAVRSFVLPTALAGEVRRSSRQFGVTPYMTLLAAFQLLLSRYSGQDDILVGSVIANRNRAEIEGLIGYFANALPLRTRFDGDPSFRELLERVKDTALEAYAHQEMPFERLVEDLRPERSLSHNPLFQVLFSLQNAPQRAFELKGLQLQPLGGVGGTTAKFDLSVFMLDGVDGLSGRIEYNTDLFDASTIDRLQNHYVGLLQAALARPETRISQLPILSSEERHRSLVEWNASDADYPRHLCLHQLFEQQVERTPDAVACVLGHQQLTYRELNQQANQLAHLLRRRGVGPGQRVGIFVERSLMMMVGLLGIQKSGAAYVPLDPAYPAERLRLTLEDAQVPLLLTQQSLLASLPEHAAEVICLDADWPQMAQESPANPATSVRPEDLVYVIFTSGSTGRPKGVQVPHRAVVNLLTCMGRQLQMGPDDVFPALASFAFDMCIPELYLALVSGGRVVIGDRHLAANGEELASLLRQTGATVVHATPTTWSLLLDAGFTGKGLKRAIGAEPLPRELCTRLLQADDSLYNFYGPTETTVWSAVHHFRSPHEPVVVGRPLANTQIYILDQHLQPVPVGVPGEIYIGGDGVTCGYLNRPELTAEKFVPDPFARRAQAVMYRTGDLGSFLADGRIEFKGRVDNQVKIRGFRIELGEVETILNRHAAVQDCAVVVREDVPGDKRLVGYVVPVAGAKMDAAELRAWVKERLPEYMVPVAWVEMQRLPLSPNGKVDRKHLPLPEYQRPERAGEYQGPRTPAEEVMAGIWAEVLKLEQVGVHDQFFELGGHSLLATQVVSRIRQGFQVELPLRALFEAPTVAGLTERVEALQREQQGMLAPPIRQVPRTGPLPLSFAQQRMWFLDRLEPGSSAYTVPHSLRLKGDLRPAVLERSLNEIIRRHETLRTSFQVINGEPVQVIESQLTMKLAIEDLTLLPADGREAEAQRRAKEDTFRPFDLTVAPLLRAKLLKLADDDHVLVLVTHHSISDGWSLSLFAQELAALYEAFAANMSSPLLELPVQYADYAVWQRDFLSGETLERQLAYWKHHLAGAPASLDLPTDYPRPPLQTYNGSRQTVVLPRSLTDSVNSLSREQGVTLFMMLLAAFNVLLSRYSCQEDVVVGTPIAGRNRAEIEKLIGFFANTLVMRTDLSGDPTFRELLARVRETAMGAYAHQDLPFEKLVEELKPERDLSRNPLFQVMLVLQNVPTSGQKMSAVSVAPFASGAQSSQFDLTLFASETPEGMRASMVYNTDLFEAQTIIRMLHQFETLLADAVAHPDKPISQLPLLTADERKRILVEFNDTSAVYPDVCVHDLVAQRTARQPDSTALVYGTERITYQELNARANQIAHSLIKRGAGPDVLVGIYMERTPALVAGILGILKAGSAYVPIDPSYPKDRLRYILEDAKAPMVLTQTSLAGEVEGFASETIRLDADWDQIALEPKTNPITQVQRGNLAYVLFTSGSTGRPKGVALEHRTPVTFIHWAQEILAPEELSGVMFSTSVCFDVSMCEMFVTLSAGGKLIMAANALELSSLPAKDEVTLINVVPSIMAELVRSGGVPASVQTVNLAGEALPDALVDQIYATTSVRRVFNLYGPTETSYSTFTLVPRGSAVTIGKPIANTQCYILDKRLEPAPIGVPGDLYISGDGEARGYYGHPELTRERFVPNPFSPTDGARMYRTGDVCRWLPDGNIQYFGRSDFQVKLRGYRIELGEIEATLDQHPSVRQSVAVVREDQPGQQRLVAYVVLHEGAEADPMALQEHIRQSLPEYMVPASVMILDAFPLTPNGKVDRRALPAPERPASSAPQSNAPQDHLELILVRIWEKVLGVPNLGVNDNFFDLGGHSILAARLLTEVEKVVGRKIPLTSLFRGSTVASLAKLLREGSECQPEPLVVEFQPGNVEFPSIFAVAAPGVRALGYAKLSRYFGPKQPFYKLQASEPIVRGERPFTMTELRDLAQQYVAGIRAIQGYKPCCLIAMCSGCQIAEQMILQMEAQGQEVKLFAILDTWVMEFAHRRWGWRLLGYQQRLRWLRKASNRERLRWFGSAVRNRLRTWTGKVRAARPWNEAYWPPEFTPPRFRAPAVLFKRPRQPYYYIDDQTMGWGARSEGGLEIQEIDVLHHEFLREFSVQTIGRFLAQRLAGSPSVVNEPAPSSAAADEVSAVTAD